VSLPETFDDWSVAQLEEAVRYHNDRYWKENAPEISDYDYDRLVEALRTRAPRSAVLDELGGDSPDRFGAPVTHHFPMLSLDKAYDEDALQKWAAKFEGELVMTPKVDGVACSIRYGADGRLVVAATRGSGTVGEDITANVKRITNVPVSIDIDREIEVRGEVYLPLSRFRQLGGQFANPRNTAAGALKQKDPDKSEAMGLRFFAYDLAGLDIDTEMHKHALTTRLGFTAVEHLLVRRDEVQSGYETYVARRNDLDFEIDGVVFKADRLDEQERLGFTSHHPRYAIAYKLQGDSNNTFLRQVEWSVSRTGAITPVGIVDPVNLSGATVTRISLHNWGLVRSKNLSLNAQVTAMRRGGVIPHLEAVATPGDTPIDPPAECPSCGTAPVVEGDFITCPNTTGCPAQSMGILGHFAKITGIEGFGDVWLLKLVDEGVLTSPADFYRLTAEQLVKFERMGKTLAQKLISQIGATRRMPLDTFLQALGVEGLGKTASGTLARHFGTLEAVRAAAPTDLLALPKFAEILANRVVDGLAARTPLIDALLEFIEVVPMEKPAAPTGGPLVGKSFLFTGTLVAMKREEAQERVVALGGSAASGVSSKLSYLVVGDDGKAGSKLDKARQAGVTVLTEGEFMALLAQSAG
jgi:DNA ligase (NAD+)